MGLLSKKEKEVERPFSLQGKDGIIKWHSENNRMLVSINGLRQFMNDYILNGIWIVPSSYKDMPTSNFKAVTDTFIHEEYVNIEEAIKGLYLANLPSLFEYFLVWCELPEMIEHMVIDRIYQFKRDLGKLNEKVNLKRQKIVGYRPVGNGY